VQKPIDILQNKQQARIAPLARSGLVPFFPWRHWSGLLALVLLPWLLLMSGCGHAPAPDPATHSQGAALTYVAIGASDTFGSGTQDPYNQNWPDDLAADLGGSIHLINLGVPGMTVHVALNAELPVAVDAHPNLVTVWLAVNDVADNVPVESYSHDLDLLLSRLQASAPRARIAVGNVPDLTSVPFFASDDPVLLSQQIETYNTAIAGVVQRHHVILVDLSGQAYNLQEFPQYISSDGLHPSAEGYVQLAGLFYQALRKS
jgi:lysophospholipase L1-like esterase